MNGISKFWYDITSTLHIYRNSVDFCPSYIKYSKYHIKFFFQFNTDTHAVHRMTQMIWDRKIPISNTTLKFNHSVSHCDIVFLQFLLRHLQFFLTFPIHFEVFIAQWSDECCEHEMNPGIVFICKLAITVILYRGTSRLADADSHYFQTRENLFRRVCLMSVPLHKNMQIQKLGY